MNINSELIESSANQISEKKQDIKYDTRDYVIDYLVQEFEKDDFYIPLEYQRQFIWSDNDKCFFIESILMGLPVPLMFFADTQDGRVEIVDGAQRTQTLVQFVQNELKLSNLRVLTESNGFTFKDLSLSVQRRFKNTNIRVVFLEEGTTEKVRQEIFKRINTGGKAATPTETRRGAFEGKFKDFLEECVRNKKFNALAPRTEQTEKRYEGFELVSRFFAYYENYSSNYNNYDGKVANYIDDYIEIQNKAAENDNNIIQNKKTIFDNMLDYAEKILGNRGFRKSETSKSTPRARFEALSVGIALALNENPDLKPKNVSDWIDSEEFGVHIKSDAANNKRRLIDRINFVKDNLLKDENI